MDNSKGNTYINVDFFEDLTGEIAKPGAQQTEAIGSRIRTIRQEKGISLEKLSHLTGFDVEMLAGIEANEIQPQLGTVIKLSKALDSALGRLLSGEGNKLYSITRKQDRKIISRSTSGKGQHQAYVYKSLAPEVEGRHMEALIVQLQETETKDVSVHDGEEFIYVLDGVVELTVHEDTHDLEPGDSAYYLSTTPHLVTAKTGTATILAVLYEG